MHRERHRWMPSLALLALVALTASGSQGADYLPGLGEFMSATQMRHIKLWFAGQARNWELASYEFDEIQEGFDDIVRYYPTHHESPIPIKEIPPTLTDQPIARLHADILARDEKQFAESFDELTSACNACHRAEHHVFNIITRPSSNPYTDQRF